MRHANSRTNEDLSQSNNFASLNSVKSNWIELAHQSVTLHGSQALLNSLAKAWSSTKVCQQLPSLYCTAYGT